MEEKFEKSALWVKVSRGATLKGSCAEETEVAVIGQIGCLVKVTVNHSSSPSISTVFIPGAKLSDFYTSLN